MKRSEIRPTEKKYKLMLKTQYSSFQQAELKNKGVGASIGAVVKKNRG